MPNSSPKLPLTEEERAKLRTCKIKLNDISHISTLELSQCLGISSDRSKYLRALAIFQTVPLDWPKSCPTYSRFRLLFA